MLKLNIQKNPEQLEYTTTGIELFMQCYSDWHAYRYMYADVKPNKLITKCDNGYPCFTGSVQQIDFINSVKSPVKVLDHTWEGPNVLSAAFMQKLSPESVYIIFTNDLSYVNFCPEVDRKICFICFPTFLYTETTRYFNCFSRFSNTHGNKFFDFDIEKSVGMLALIGEYRKNRHELFYRLQEEYDFDKDKIAIRYGDDIHGVTSVFEPDIIKNSKGTHTHKMEPAFGRNTSIKPWKNWQTLPIDIYNQCQFMLLVETSQEKDRFHLTEKTMKCLYSGMPFIVFSSTNYLKNLQDMGFQTYHSLWDESYDSVDGDAEKITRVIDICKQLENFDWKAAASDLKQIHYHNLKNLSNINLYFDTVFEDIEATVQDFLAEYTE